MRWILLLLTLLMIGCGERTGGGTDDAASSLPWWARLTPSEIITAGAAAVASLGVLCTVAAIALFLMGRRKLAGTALAAAGACIAAAPVLYWFGANLVWITIIAAVLGAVVAVLVARRSIGKIETFLGVDLNRNQEIGS